MYHILKAEQRKFMTLSIFTINIQDIEEDGLHVSYNDLASCRGFDPELPEGMELQGPFFGSADFFRDGRQLHLTGEVRGKLVMACHRCLEQCSLVVGRKFYYMLEPADDFGDDAAREVSLDAQDLDVWHFRHGEVRLDRIFREQLLLQIPIKALCSDDCRGLCPGCGQNLNIEECKCEHGSQNSPFAVLSQLKLGGG